MHESFTHNKNEHLSSSFLKNDWRIVVSRIPILESRTPIILIFSTSEIWTLTLNDFDLAKKMMIDVYWRHAFVTLCSKVVKRIKPASGLKPEVNYHEAITQMVADSYAQEFNKASAQAPCFICNAFAMHLSVICLAHNLYLYLYIYIYIYIHTCIIVTIMI